MSYEKNNINNKETRESNTYNNVYNKLKWLKTSFRNFSMVYGGEQRTKIEKAEIEFQKLFETFCKEYKDIKDSSKSEISQLLEYLSTEFNKIDFLVDLEIFKVVLIGTLSEIENQIKITEPNNIIYCDDEWDDDPIEALMKTGVTVMDFSKPRLSL